jgi:hypothetical protein
MGFIFDHARELSGWLPSSFGILCLGRHASTLLYAVLHLAGVNAVYRKYEKLGESPVPIEDFKSSGKRSVNG